PTSQQQPVVHPQRPRADPHHPTPDHAGPAEEGALRRRGTHSAAIRRERTSATNTGPPRTAAAIPVCNSAGATAHRPSTSAVTRNAGETTSAAGNSRR